MCLWLKKNFYEISIVSKATVEFVLLWDSNAEICTAFRAFYFSEYCSSALTNLFLSSACAVTDWGNRTKSMNYW